MVDVLKTLLRNKDTELYHSYLAVETLLKLTYKSKNLNLELEYLLNILNTLLEKSEFIIERSTLFSRLTAFYFELAKLYRAGKFQRVNFLLDKEDIFIEIKDWIKDNKNLIYNIFEYYFETTLLEKRDFLFSDNLFQVSKVTHKKSSTFMVSRPNVEEISIRVILSGMVYYKNKILVKSEEYIISNDNLQLGRFKLFSDEAVILDITLKSKFIENFGISMPNRILHVKSPLYQKTFEKLLNPQTFQKNFLLFFELMTLILKINSLIPNNIVTLSEVTFDKKGDIKQIIDTINENILESENNIKELLFYRLRINSSKLDDIFYDYYKTTFKKYILKLKCNYIIKEYINNDISLESLIEKYRYSNIKNFQYNIRTFFQLNMKKINEYKASKKN